MIFDQMEFHNVEAMVWEEDGYKMSRLPRDVAKQLDQGIRDNTSFLSTGVEVRFRLTGEEVKLHLRADPDEEAQTVLIYYGSFQGGMAVFCQSTWGDGNSYFSKISRRA